LAAEKTTDSYTLARFRPHSRYWHFASIKLQGPGGFLSSPTLLVAPLCKHYGATQYSALSAHLLDVRPTAGTRINSCHRVSQRSYWLPTPCAKTHDKEFVVRFLGFAVRFWGRVKMHPPVGRVTCSYAI
jgi:hypothetical protein